ncbi:MAG: nuclear transport factor 2 family protein [Planctomycetia bacterium]|nr:nuclear transport factor 2 family protein [Planctomycetia bacterium]
MIAAPFDFADWLVRYGNAWTGRDAEAVCRLFSPEAAYYETPFDPPMTGTAAIRRYWTDGAVNGQRDVVFAATPLTIDGRTGFAHWRATFRRATSNTLVELEGILSARFDETGRCAEFREWWHRRETPAEESQA